MAESRKPVISVHDLAKNYGELKVLRKIDMDIYKGEVVSVIGPSGSGKSTFLRLLDGFSIDPPREGGIKCIFYVHRH